MPPEEPTASVSAPQRTASQLGYEVRHTAPAPMPGSSGPVIRQESRIAGTSALSDPWGSGLLPGSASALFNRRPPRAGGGPTGSIGAHESPLDLGGVGDVIAGNGTGSEYDKPGDEDAAAEEQPRQTYPSDADPPTQGIHSDGMNLVHLRMTGPSSGGSTGAYATHVGAPGDGAI
jgi:hypothetical protein